MHDRARHRALVRIAAVRAAQRAAAELAVLAASEREQLAVEASREADARTEAADRDWRAHMSAGAVLPELLVGLAARVNERAGEGLVAHRHSGELAERHAEARTEWRAGDARCRQADQLAATSRRALVRAREERALEHLADRVTFAWSRR